MEVSDLLKKAKIIPDPYKDQCFLTDLKIPQQMIALADLDQKDTVLEIGAGLGILTFALAKKAGKIISFEIDQRLKIYLQNLPPNVDLRFADAWEYVQLHGKFNQKKEYNKIVSNLPFSFAEKFLHNLTFLIYDRVILLIPQSLSQKIVKNPLFSSFFEVKEKLVVEKNKFYPIPQTKSVVIDLIKLPNPLSNNNLSLFLRQFVYQHEQAKLKNSLQEGLIKFVYLSQKRRLTKRKAQVIIKALSFQQEMLEEKPTLPTYLEINEKFTNTKLPDF